MSVYNSKHNSPLNSNHDNDIHDSVTRISKLDISDLLHLHPNDTTALTVVSIKLKGTKNYQVWSCAMLLALEGKNKIGFIDGSCKRSNTDEVLGKQWDMVNAIILGWILNSIYEENGSYIDDYYHKLNALWKEYDAMIELPKCVCHGSEETLPNVRSDYATISSEESHIVVVDSIAGSSQRNQASAFVQGGGSGFNNNRPSGGFGLVCENCGFNGHTIDRYFKITGYPADFGKKKSGQNSKKQNVSNNNSVGKSSSSGFSDEQMTTLLSLIKDNKIGKNVQANMAGANQHMTYTTKRLDNVVDISHLKIKVGHLNGTKAFISKIGNLKLSTGFESENVLGNGDQCEGLYYYNEQEPVMNVLKKSLNFDKSDKGLCCEVCQRAKKTREPFPLIDHVSSSLGELVHMDLWGPYRVISSEGFKYFLTIVDDYTRSVWVYLIKSKDEVSHFITVFYNLIENQFNKKIKVFRSDNGTKFVNQYVDKFCADKDVNHINFFDLEYPKIPNDDERVDPNLNCDINKSQSASSSSSESGEISATAAFLVNSGNDADSSDKIFAT
ncbi:ribonuclease H-like domain-containing protein [Tanacetum coccineum]